MCELGVFRAPAHIERENLHEEEHTTSLFAELETLLDAASAAGRGEGVAAGAGEAVDGIKALVFGVLENSLERLRVLASHME